MWRMSHPSHESEMNWSMKFEMKLKWTLKEKWTELKHEIERVPLIKYNNKTNNKQMLFFQWLISNLDSLK